MWDNSYYRHDGQVGRKTYFFILKYKCELNTLLYNGVVNRVFQYNWGVERYVTSWVVYLIPTHATLLRPGWNLYPHSVLVDVPKPTLCIIIASYMGIKCKIVEHILLVLGVPTWVGMVLKLLKNKKKSLEFDNSMNTHPYWSWFGPKYMQNNGLHIHSRCWSSMSPKERSSNKMYTPNMLQ